MLPAFEQLCLLLAFLTTGYVFGRCGLIDQAHAKVLSVAGVYLFLPSTIFNSFSKSFTRSNLTTYFSLLLTSLIVLLVLIALAQGASRLMTKQAYEQKVFCYSLIVPNYGYMGYAMAEGLFGAEGLLELILFSLPVSIFTYTVGFAMLTKRPLSLKKLFNPVNTAVLLGILVGLFNIRTPAIATQFLNKSAACMAPVSMLLTGLTISSFDLKKMVSNKKSYLLTAMRLLVIPVCLALILKAIAVNPDVIGIAVLFYCMPCGMNTIVFPKLVDEDCSLGASLALLSNVLSIATIPLCLSLI